jgi:hypothetical protein
MKMQQKKEKPVEHRMFHLGEGKLWLGLMWMTNSVQTILRSDDFKVQPALKLRPLRQERVRVARYAFSARGGCLLIRATAQPRRG